jgi:hypothetical protein
MQKPRRRIIGSVSVHRAVAVPPLVDAPLIVVDHPSVADPQSLVVSAAGSTPLLECAPLYLAVVGIFLGFGAAVAGTASTEECQDGEGPVHSSAEPESVPRSFGNVRQSCYLETDAEAVEWHIESGETQYDLDSVQMQDADG